MPRRTSVTPTAASRSTASDSGSTFAGEKPGFVADALNRLSAQAPYLYVDRNRYWFDLQQNVNRTARDEAARLLHGRQARGARRDRPAAASRAGRRRLPPGARRPVDERRRGRRPDGAARGARTRRAAHREGGGVTGARVVAQRSSTSEATAHVSTATCSCSLPATNDRSKVSSSRPPTSWRGRSICDRVEELNLDAHQTTQAKTRRQQSDDAVGLRLAEAYKYALVPRQDDPIGPVTFDVVSLDQQGSVAQRASRKLVSRATSPCSSRP